MNQRRRQGKSSNARPGEPEEEDAGPPEQRGMWDLSSKGEQNKNPAALLQSGEIALVSLGNSGLYPEICPLVPRSAARERPRQASWLMAHDDVPPPSHPRGADSGSQFASHRSKIVTDANGRTSRQLQWRDRTGFTPDFLFSPFSASRHSAENEPPTGFDDYSFVND